MDLPQANCAYHPDRPGVGICMSCKTVICTECSTRIDGINHCTRCLERIRKDLETEEPDEGGWTPSRIVALLGLFILVLGGVYVLMLLYVLP